MTPHWEERTVSRGRIADDFAAIRARMEELQRERARNLASDQSSRERLVPRPLRIEAREQQSRARILPVVRARPVS
jgi:hypothetical protein